MTPTIHLNGTAAQTLIEQTEAVLDAAHALKSALYDAQPNARDFYPQGEGAYQAARRKHDEHLRTVGNLIEAFGEQLADLIDQQDKRRK